jgi:hypothetical protein
MLHFWKVKARQKILDQAAADIPWVQSAFNFFMN